MIAKRDEAMLREGGIIVGRHLEVEPASFPMVVVKLVTGGVHDYLEVVSRPARPGRFCHSRN